MRDATQAPLPATGDWAHDVKASVRCPTKRTVRRPQHQASRVLHIGHGLRITRARARNSSAASTSVLPVSRQSDLLPEESRPSMWIAQRGRTWQCSSRVPDAHRPNDRLRHQQNMANNLEEARIQAPAPAGATSRWDFNAAASYSISATAASTIRQAPPRRRAATGRLGVDRAFGDWRIGASSWARGVVSTDFGTGSRRGFSRRHGRMAHRDAWNLQARASKVLDRITRPPRTTCSRVANTA